jgi:hypothetical protein
MVDSKGSKGKRANPVGATIYFRHETCTTHSACRFNIGSKMSAGKEAILLELRYLTSQESPMEAV